jgi:hypothetical protein
MESSSLRPGRLKLRERQAQIDDIERLIAQTDATVERAKGGSAAF